MSSGNAPTRRRTTDEIKTLLELPFRSAEINWRVFGDGEKIEGEARIVLYANRAAYVRRPDILFRPRRLDTVSLNDDGEQHSTFEES